MSTGKGSLSARTHAAFDSRWHTAEYLWEAAEKVGKRSIVIKLAFYLAGADARRVAKSPAMGCPSMNGTTIPPFNHAYTFSGDALFSTDDYVEGTLVEVDEVEDWQGPRIRHAVP